MNNSYGKAELGRAFVLRISKGNELISELKRFCKEHEIKSASLNFLGAFSKAKITCINKIEGSKLISEEFEFNEFLEFHGFGTIALQDKEIMPHLHATAATKEGKTFCGHLHYGEIGVIAEIFLQELNAEMNRIPNKEIYGYPVLTMEKDW
ncbi:MAG: DUF296 domain-containing protein [Candidatus Diapherotrites archaeon]